eukprot:363869-Chlamydomonas_euryale.AAC.12
MEGAAEALSRDADSTPVAWRPVTPSLLATTWPGTLPYTPQRAANHACLLRDALTHETRINSP